MRRIPLALSIPLKGGHWTLDTGQPPPHVRSPRFLSLRYTTGKLIRPYEKNRLYRYPPFRCFDNIEQKSEHASLQVGTPLLTGLPGCTKFKNLDDEHEQANLEIFSVGKQISTRLKSWLSSFESYPVVNIGDVHSPALSPALVTRGLAKAQGQCLWQVLMMF